MSDSTLGTFCSPFYLVLNNMVGYYEPQSPLHATMEN